MTCPAPGKGLAFTFGHQGRGHTTGPELRQHGQTLQVAAIVFHQQPAGSRRLIIHKRNQMRCPFVVRIEFLREPLLLYEYLIPDQTGLVRQRPDSFNSQCHVFFHISMIRGLHAKSRVPCRKDPV